MACFFYLWQRQLFKILTVSILLLSISGCGQKEGPNDAKALLNANSSYCPLGNLEQIELVNEVEIYESEQMSFSSVSETYIRDFNESEPLVLSYSSLRNKFESFKRISGPLSPLETTEWRQFKGDLLRWRDYQCSLDILAKKNDIDIGLITRTEFESSREDSLKLCRPFERGVRCEAYWEIHRRRGSQGSFRRHYRDQFASRAHAKLFELKPNHGLKFRCENEQMLLRIRPPQSWGEHELKSVKSLIENVWKKEGLLEIKVEWTQFLTDAEVHIENTDRSLSFVRDDDFRTIHISAQTSPFMLPLVVAHELGHVLGLPDCYVEYYDHESESIIYYEPSGENKNNLMCSMKWGNGITSHAMEQIKSQKCLP